MQERILTIGWGQKMGFISSIKLRAGVNYDIKCRMWQEHGEGESG